MTMLWQVVLQVSLVLIVSGMHVVHDPFFAASSTGVSCIDYTNEGVARNFNEGWRSQKSIFRKSISKRSSGQPMFNVLVSPHMSNNFIENLIPNDNYLVKEHAKLVHDINSLRQAVFVRPFAEENKDYDDSIFPEIIETSTFPGLPFTKHFPSVTRKYSTSTKASSIPIILVGGASQRQVVKSQPVNFAKPTISLIGTTISPLIKHPYPFVMHRKPVKICVTALPPIPSQQPTTKTLWQRLIEYFVPKSSLGR